MKLAKNYPIDSYLTTALWSSTDDEGEPMDREYTTEDFTEDARGQATKDWQRFQTLAGALLDGLDLNAVAHDFWLSRNRHGAGFWDGDYTQEGDKLTEIAHQLGEVRLAVTAEGGVEFI